MIDVKGIGYLCVAAISAIMAPLSVNAEYIKWEASLRLWDEGLFLGRYWTPSILHDEHITMTFYFDASSTWGSPNGSYPITVPAYSGAVSISGPHRARILSLPYARLSDYDTQQLVGGVIALNGNHYGLWWFVSYIFIDPWPGPGEQVKPEHLPQEADYISNAGLSDGYLTYYFSHLNPTITYVDEAAPPPEVPLPMSLPLLASGLAVIGWWSRRQTNLR